MRPAGLVFLVILFGWAELALSQIAPFVLDESSVPQNHPCVNGTLVVWNEYVDGGFLVRGKDLAGGSSFTTDGLDEYELDPVTNGSVVVWRDKRTGNFDLYAMDVQTGEQWALVDEPNSQTQQAISSNYVVWKDARNSPSGVPSGFGNHDIYAVDLVTGEEFRVCTAPFDQSSPDVSGKVIVWADKRRYIPGITPKFTSDIYGYDIATGEEFLIAPAAEGAGNSGPAISGSIVVWQDGRNGGDIMGYDLAADMAFPIHVESQEDYSGQTAPDIDGHHVVWVDGRDGAEGAIWSIRGYDLRSGEEFVIFQDAGYVYSPSVSGNLVAWTWHPVGEANERIMAAYIPEPGSFLLLAGCGAALAARRRRRRERPQV